MAGLAEAIQGAVGQPASVRVGTVDSSSPLVISAQGVQFDDVGILGNYAPQTGETVALLGQCSEAGSDPASWLALGSVRPATTPAGELASNVQDGMVAFTNTGYLPGIFLCSTAFVAPPSGSGMVTWRAGLNITGGAPNQGFASWEIREGADLSLGTLTAYVSADTRCISTSIATTLNLGSSAAVFGLTPGATYNITMTHRTNNAAAAANFVNREVCFNPS